MSHLDTLDLKPGAPAEIRGEFTPIATNVPGIHIGEHLPLLAQQMDKLAVIRSMHHDDGAHGRGMYWMLTGHKPPRVGNIPPLRADWPSLPAVVSRLRTAQRGIPSAVRLPYPLVDNGTLQAGEWGGWLGARHDPIVLRPPAGEPFSGVSRSLGAEVLNLETVDVARLQARHSLIRQLDRPPAGIGDGETHDYFQDLALNILSGDAVREAYDLDREDPRIRERYGTHLGGQSLLLARRLTEAGVSVVQVCHAAGDLNGTVGDHWDTHGDNFNKLRHRLLPVLDRSVSALLTDLAERGTLDDTLVAVLSDFGRTPVINAAAGRDHYPNVFSIMLAGGGIRGGQVYGSSDARGALPKDRPCSPADLQATMFSLLGISPRAELHDPLGRPFPISDGQVLPLV